MNDTILPCKCGSDGRLRHKGEFSWVECKRRNCGMHSGFVRNVDNKGDQAEADKFTIQLWNRMVRNG